MAARSKQSLLHGEPLRKSKIPKTWMKHEHSALEGLVGQSFDLLPVASDYPPRRVYPGGHLKITSLLSKGSHVYVYGGLFNDQEVIVKGTLALYLGVSQESSLHRLQNDICYHTKLQESSVLGIPLLHGSWVVGSYGFYVIQRFSRDLQSHISGMTLEKPMVYNWIRQLLTLMESFHKRGGLFHMDLKPANIVLDETGCLYLIDFETSWRTNTLEIRYERDLALGMLPKVASGTLPFKSTQAHRPRQSRIGYRSDLESLVFISEFLLTGTLPWEKIKDPDEVYEAKMVFVSQDPPTQRLWESVRSLNAEDIPDYKGLGDFFV